MKSDNEMKEVLFDLTNDALYVANSGQPFTRKGVIGICASHRSEKTDFNSDTYDDVKGADLISKIREKRIEMYKIDPDQSKEDAGHEEGIHLDYSGRFAWELLQNADDAMGSDERPPADLIGSKGLGFKSVLEITEEPEIHSDPFHFKFSPDQTKELLKEKGISGDPPRLTFRIPHDCLPNDKVCGLLEAGYSTVIRLPFRDEEAREKAKSILETLEPCFLLLSQELESVRIILDGEKRGFRVERKMQGFSDGRMVLHSPEGRTDWQRWTGTKNNDNAKRLTVAIALPLDEKGKVVPHADEMPLHVFFPTEEQLGVKALLHASFDLQQNRKRLREGNYDKELRDLFGQVLERVIKDIPARTALETFGSISADFLFPKLIDEIKSVIEEKMRTTPFVPVIGGGKVSPCESTLWKDGLGRVLRKDEPKVKKAALISPRVSLLSDSFCALKELGARDIDNNDDSDEDDCSTYVELLRYCRNKSLKDCIASFRVLVEGGLKRVPWDRPDWTRTLLREVPCWWTEDEQARSLAAKPPLLWEKPKKWPGWLRADSLHPEFRTKIKKEEEQKGEEWEELTDGFLLRGEKDYIDRVLIPFVETWGQKNWQRLGFRVLQIFSLWESRHNFDRTEPWIKGEEGRRDRLATVLRLPTDKGWLPAIDCFAGKDWDGPEAFDEFFKERKRSGIVQSFEKWPKYLQKTDKETWKGLLRWLGVSWEPKVYQTRHLPWGEIGKDYKIQDFPDCIAKVKTREIILKILPTLSALLEGKYPPGKLREKAWLPVKTSLLETRRRIQPNKAFLPNKGLSGLLPEVDRSGIDDNAWRGIESKLRDLGVMDKLPDQPWKWHKWMKNLAGKGRQVPEEEREAPPDWKDGKERPAKNFRLWRAAQSLYREYQQRFAQSSDDFPSNIEIPCVCLKDDRRVLTFAQPGKVHWIDKPYLADLTLEKELLTRGYKLFIFRLQEENKPEQLDVRRLSDSIRCRPYFVPSNNDETRSLSQRYKNRRVVLEKVLKIELPGTMALKAVKNLVLELSTKNGRSVGCCPVRSWKEERTNSVLVDIEKNKWRSLAGALARLDEKYAKHANDFEVYLADDDDKSVLERARNVGVPEEALEEVASSLEPDGQSEETGEGDEEREEANSEGRTEKSTSNSAPLGRPSKTRSRRRRETQGKRQHSNGENQTGELHTESGLEAERWLEERLREVWPDEVEKVHTGRDFTLSVGGQTVNIEAKHVKNPPGAIHWSDSQYKTSRNEEAYFIAVLSPGQNDDAPYLIHWIWDPLEHMKDMDRHVTWSGKSKPEQLQTGDWNMADTRPPNVSPEKYEIEVKLTNDVFDEKNRDSPQLEKLRARIEGL